MAAPSSSVNNETPQKIFHVTIPFDELNLWKFFTLNAAVYFGETAVYYPFDVLRTKLQVSRDVKFNIGKSINMIRSMGVRGLYTGFMPYSLGSLPSHGLYFASYNVAKDNLQQIHDRFQTDKSVKGKQAMWVSFAAGGIAEIACNGIWVPLEVVIQRLQIQDKNSPNRYNGAWHASKVIYKTDGVRGFYRGFGATLLTYAPASAIWWAAYEQFKADLSYHVFSSTKSDSGAVHVEQSVPAQVTAGALAGFIAAVLTNPMDVVKTRLQTQHHQQHIEKDVVTALYKNSYEAFVSMMKQEGWKAFTRGLGPRVITSTFFSSWFGLIYEAVVNWSKK